MNEEEELPEWLERRKEDWLLDKELENYDYFDEILYDIIVEINEKYPGYIPVKSVVVHDILEIIYRKRNILQTRIEELERMIAHREFMRV